MRKPILFFKINGVLDLNMNYVRGNEEVFDINLYNPSFVDSIKLSKIRLTFFIWFLFRVFRLFKSPYYVVILTNSKKEVVHHFVLLPRSFKYPFMEEGDLQIGDVWTRDDYRGQNISAFVISKVLKDNPYNRYNFWYLTELENTASINLARKLNLHLEGEGYVESKLLFKLIKTNIYNI
jgi:hypothetical protein